MDNYTLVSLAMESGDSDLSFFFSSSAKGGIE